MVEGMWNGGAEGNKSGVKVPAVWGQVSGLGCARATLRLEEELFVYVFDGYRGGWSMEWHAREERQLRGARTGSSAQDRLQVAVPWSLSCALCCYVLPIVLLCIKPGLALYPL